MLNITIREPEESEIISLQTFLYHAIFQPPGSEPLAKNIIKTPEINIYIDQFGNDKHDSCLVAEINNIIIGGVWTRVLYQPIKGYGNIDSQTPEFIISILPNYRNKGIGTLLMQKMIILLTSKKYNQTSLSVNKNNKALRFYQKLGFTIIQERKEDYLMLLELQHKQV